MLRLKTPFHFLFSQLFGDTERERDNIVWKVKAKTEVLPITRHVGQAEPIWSMFPNRFVGMPIARVDSIVSLEHDFFCHDDHLNRVLLNQVSDAEIDRINAWTRMMFEYEPDRLVNSADDLAFRDYGSGIIGNEWYSELWAAGFTDKVYTWTMGNDIIANIFAENVYAYELYNAPMDEDGNTILGFLIRAESLIADYVEFDDNTDDTDSDTTV
jgi:hypothetical protein